MMLCCSNSEQPYIEDGQKPDPRFQNACTHTLTRCPDCSEWACLQGTISGHTRCSSKGADGRATQLTYRHWRVYMQSTWYPLLASHGRRATRIHLKVWCMPSAPHRASQGTTPTAWSGGPTMVIGSRRSLWVRQPHTTSHLWLLQQLHRSYSPEHCDVT